jgi:hypothetical protein
MPAMRRSSGSAAATSCPVPARNTSQSRARPSAAPSSCSCGFSAWNAGPSVTLRNTESADRSRRTATRMACTGSGVSPAEAAGTPARITSVRWPTTKATASPTVMPGGTSGAPALRSGGGQPRAKAAASVAWDQRGTSSLTMAVNWLLSSMRRGAGPSNMMRQDGFSCAMPRRVPSSTTSVASCSPGTRTVRRWPRKPATGIRGSGRGPSVVRSGDSATSGEGVPGGHASPGRGWARSSRQSPLASHRLK